MVRRSRHSTSSGDADAALMVEAAGGCQEAFGQLIRRHQPLLMNFFARLGADVHEAEDAVQETFLRIFNFRKRYRPEAPFRVFLYTVARHAWVDLARRRNRWRRGEAPGISVETQPAPDGLPQADRMDLEAALDGLSRGHRMVLVLSIFGGLRYEEISHVMGIPQGTVKSRVFHALRKLRKSMSGERYSPRS